MEGQDWVEVKFTGGQHNKQQNYQKKPPVKLTDEQIRLNKIENEEYKPKTISLELKKVIQQSRLAKKISQSALAKSINEKPGVINEYESGKAIPNNNVLGKLERALGVKLRGKNIGQSNK